MKRMPIAGVILLATAAALGLAYLGLRPNSDARITSLPEFQREGVAKSVVQTIDGLEQAVAKRPTAENWGRLGMGYWAHLAKDQARECFETAVELDPESFQFRYYLAVLLEETDWGLSAEQYELAFQTRSDYPPMLMRYAELLLQLDRASDAERLFAKAMEYAPKSPYPLIGIAETAEQAGDSERAEIVLRQAVELAPRSRQANSLLARQLRINNELDESMQVHLRASMLPHDARRMPDKLVQEVQQYESDSRRLAQTADQLYLSGQFELAASQFLKLLNAKPNWARARLGMARCLLQMREPDGAKRLLRETIEDFPNEAESHEILAAVHESVGETRLAELQYRDCIEKQPTNGNAHFALGLLLENGGRVEEAIESYRNAIAAAPQFPPAQLALGAALLTAKRPEEAETFIQNAVDLAPHDPVPAGFLKRVKQELHAIEERKSPSGKAANGKAANGKAEPSRFEESR